MGLENSSYIEDQIELGSKEPVSHSVLHMKAKIIDKYEDKIIHCSMPLVTKYGDLLNPYIEEVEFDEYEFLKYKYKPRLLSLDIYDTPELWSAILLINNMVSVIDFTKRKIKLFKTNIMDIFEEMLILEEDNLRDNNDDMAK